ncbi:MAG TPA: M1 family aminopeptidase, partial [Flavisolibacter sp.]|nr:M1 family aminopeptidase [Flavisolibacter sp.]
STTKTWFFAADSVRDFAWTSSRKYVWDAMPAEIEGRKSKTMCMSFYPKEAYTLWSRYSTKAVAHTIKTYSHYTIPYPYPVAQSVEAANGMEYPMICFNYGRTNKDGSYTEQIKYGMLGVIIHEVGHNFFPMIINSDERQWSWMDEGLNTFVQYLAQESFDDKFPSRRGPAWAITDYMKLPKDQLEPIMTNSENIVNFGSNAYGKPATALNILRETIMGRELFDYAFKQYAQRWAFKHPTPADFFRTMEDASGEDLDWFWRGWFYSTDACDISLDSVKIGITDPSGTVRRNNNGPGLVQAFPGPQGSTFNDITKTRNKEEKMKFATDTDTSLRDFYWRYNRGLESVDTSIFVVTASESTTDSMSDEEKKKFSGKYYYELSLSNKGGLVMPIIIEWTFKDGSKELDRIPAQVWRINEKYVVKTFNKEKEVTAIRLDPFKETADIDESNNTWGNTSQQPTRLQMFKARQQVRGQSTGPNPMQKAMEQKKGF